MAAFPPPMLHLHVPEPLAGLFYLGTVRWLSRPERNQLDRDLLLDRLRDRPPREPWPLPLRQFEVMLAGIRRHRGPVRVDDRHGAFERDWQTPHDCLTHFEPWREAISEAVRAVTDPPFYRPARMTETVLALRVGILAENAFDRLPVLADALEEAGCDNRGILDHLRADEEHTHTCWVLDLLSEGSGQPQWVAVERPPMGA